MASSSIAAPGVVKQAESQLILAEQSVVAGQVDTTETPARYLAFLARIRPVLQPATRYLAYTSDVGEAARPVVSPRLVTAAYGVSWLYLAGDVGYEGYKARLRAQNYCPERQTEVIGLAMTKRAIFQATASMLLPSLTIHSLVRYSAVAIKKANVKNVRIRQWGPSVLGLSAIPALPYMFDESTEHVVDKAFETIETKWYTGSENSALRKALKEEGHGQGQVPHALGSPSEKT